ncbi:hypothetical protein PGTUg99_030045 [Puccinia graminis f. sp. tritici]|uniref:Uncharacterized protein n=1 Tax=Puccinia graminis f. sp. tritici TaxID=56615 RepID=A0A5B0S7Q5_PUCGR|nr:hypothetical protein PGTUg99_030045 [Puccinia graminis f. sp. tritici]
MVHPLFHDNNELEQLESELEQQPPELQESNGPSGVRHPRKRNRLADLSPNAVHTKRNRPEPDGPSSELPQRGRPSRPCASTSRIRRQERVRENSYVPQSPFPDDSVSEHESHARHPGDSDVPLLVANQRKRKQPHDSPASPQRQKKRATTALQLIPTAAQVSRQRSRNKRVHRNSLTVRPSYHDDEVIVPSYHPSASGVESWRSSLPRNLPSPTGPSSPSERVVSRREINPGLVAGCSCPGQQLVSQITEASGLLAHCLETVNLSSLRPSSSGDPISTTRSGPRNLSLLARVRQHIKALFGKCMHLNQFPPPATKREKANWKYEELDNVDNDSSGDESASNASRPSLDLHDDPSFPYPNGPGHKDASVATLSIMWRCMQQCGVVSFRPDLARGPHDTDNAFLWDLAHKIFLKLVAAQEYSEIDLEDTSEAKVRQAIYNHAKQIHRTYREAAWDPQRLDHRAILKR